MLSASSSVLRQVPRRSCTLVARAGRSFAVVADPVSSVTTSSSSFPVQSVITTFSCQNAQRFMSGNNGNMIDPRHGTQRELWEYYLQNDGASVVAAAALFDALDLNFDGKISVKEIEYFVQSVENASSSVEASAMDLLVKMGHEQELTELEFRLWLSIKVKKSAVNDDATIGNKDEESSRSGQALDNTTSAIQSAIWGNYLSGIDPVNTAADLYRTIDLDSNGTISVNEIEFFVNAIERRGVDDDEVKELMEEGQDHQLTEAEFAVWLAGAVCPDHDHLTDRASRQDADGCAPQHAND